MYLSYKKPHFVNDTELEKIYSFPYRVALDTKSRKFQYKLLNRLLVTNTFLCKIGIIPSSACSLCGESDELLEHLFLSCHYNKNFWSEVIKWLVDPQASQAHVTSVLCKLTLSQESRCRVTSNR